MTPAPFEIIPEYGIAAVVPDSAFTVRVSTLDGSAISATANQFSVQDGIFLRVAISVLLEDENNLVYTFADGLAGPTTWFFSSNTAIQFMGGGVIAPPLTGPIT